MIGKKVSHYRILEKLGEGGMGVVYKAEDTKLKRTVALKFLPPELTRDPEAKERFVHEARAASALDHPNICTIHEIDEADGQTFIAMAYVEGQSLKDKIKTGPLKLGEAVGIGVQVAEGLHEAHNRSIVHRDIKPANIMVTTSGQAKIMDFGLAKLSGQTKLTKEGTTLGTVAYMSPEQARGESVDHRTDIWSLGVVLYEMITGQVPFKGEYEQAVVYSILNEDPESITGLRTGVPMELERITNKCLEKEPSGRYQHVDELLVDLRSITKGFESGRMEPRPTRAKRPKTKRVYLYVGLLILLLLFVVGRFYFFSGRSESIDSIAVLPFENKSEDPNMEYLSDEIPASIINSLSRLSDLRVVPRSTVFRYKGQKDNLATVGRELNVAAALTGQVSLFGDNLSIRAELVDLEHDRQLWGDRFNRKFADILEIEEEIAREISEALRLRLTGEEKTKLAKRYTKNTEAYGAYLEGRFWWNKRSQEGFDRAIELFEEAILIDPDYALAYAGKAESYCMLAIHVPRPEEFIRRGREAAEKALSLDETLAAAHTSLAWIKAIYDWDWLGAERSFKHSIQLDPHYPTTYNWYPVILSVLGRHDEALQYITRALQLDPGSLIINRDYGCVLSWAGKLDEAIAQLKRTVDMDPSFGPAHMHLARVYVAKGMYDEAITEFQTSGYYRTTGSLGYTYAKSGRREDALNELQKLMQLSKSQDVSAFEVAMIYTGLGDKKKAIEWLEQSCENREFPIILINIHPWLDSLRSEPGFKALLRKIGLEP